MRTTVVACLGLLVGVAAATATEPGNIVMCRMIAPADCYISPHPQAQAQYREICRQMPAKCKFRADGTVERWTGHVMVRVDGTGHVMVWDPVVGELRNHADDALARLRAPQDVFGGIDR